MNLKTKLLKRTIIYWRDEPYGKDITLLLPLSLQNGSTTKQSNDCWKAEYPKWLPGLYNNQLACISRRLEILLIITWKTIERILGPGSHYIVCALTGVNRSRIGGVTEPIKFSSEELFIDVKPVPGVIPWNPMDPTHSVMNNMSTQETDSVSYIMHLYVSFPKRD